MKNLCFYSAIAVSIALAAVFGCSTKSDLLPRLDIAHADGKELSGASMNFTEEGGDATIRITCNAEWRIGCDASWINFSVREGRGDAEVIVTVGGAESSRSAAVTVGMPDFSQMRRSFDVVQRVTTAPDEPEIVVPDEPSAPDIREMTVAELNAAMPASEGSIVADECCDIRFEGVVQNDASGGNYPPHTLFLADADASDAGNGICLSGDAVDSYRCGAACGDRITVTLRAGKAMLVNRGGMRYATGDGEWVTVEKNGEGESVARRVADPSLLADYCGMTVAVDGARPTAGGVWCSTSDGLHEFSVSGTVFDVCVRAAASVFADREFHVREGTVTGIATVCDGRVRIYPRNAADVADFDARPDENVSDTPSDSDDKAVTTLAQLSAGRYYMGGYRDGVLYLASGGITSAGHADTVVWDFDDDGVVLPAGDSPVEVILEAADVRNGYYIRFADEGYLTAVGAGPGNLRLSSDRERYWIFSERTGGFDVRQAGDTAVKIVISERASSALLRSVAIDEEGNPIVLFRCDKTD